MTLFKMDDNTQTQTVTSAELHQDWGRRLLSVSVLILASMAVFWPTLHSMIAIWWRSETFAHGFLIFPITLYLIWGKRESLRELSPRTDPVAIPVLVLLGFGWLLANLTDVQVVQQLLFVCMLIAAVWLLLGREVVRSIAFPLAFLLFAVPIGEGLVPPLMDFTAVFTVNALRFSGIPVFWEGTFFSIPSGDWSVVEGCSGVRYLIASITLGVLYAYLTYYSIWRRLLFIALAMIFPLIANGLRAYMIVMIAHLSDMKLALGVDHIIYGWVFFGIVMLLLFWIGTFWRDDAPDTDKDAPKVVHDEKHYSSGLLSRVFPALVAGILVITVWPVWATFASVSPASSDDIVLNSPAESQSWKKSDVPLTEWKARYVNPGKELQQTYTRKGEHVGLYLAYYPYQNQESELINSQNVLVVQKHPVWQMRSQEVVTRNIAGSEYRLYESRLVSKNQSLLVWHWNRVGDHHMVNPYMAKIREAMSKLTGGRRDATGVVVYTVLDTDMTAARQRLQNYLQDMKDNIDASLDTLHSGAM